MNSELIKKLIMLAEVQEGDEEGGSLIIATALREAANSLISSDRQLASYKDYMAAITDLIERAMRRPKP